MTVGRALLVAFITAGPQELELAFYKKTSSVVLMPSLSAPSESSNVAPTALLLSSAGRPVTPDILCNPVPALEESDSRVRIPVLKANVLPATRRIVGLKLVSRLLVVRGHELL